MINHHIHQNRKSYFEGWYFKHQNKNETIAFIPGVHFDKNGKPSAFIQVITNTGSHIIPYPYNEFFADKKKLYIKIGSNIFCRRGIQINIQTPEFSCKGLISYGSFTPVAYDIMGPFAWLKNMECNHGIISLSHKLKGSLLCNGKKIRFHKGHGYIEKDWGTSFPKSYTWLHCNHFDKKISIVASVAEIPFCGRHFRGIIAIVYANGRQYRLATYNGAKVLYAGKNGITIKKGRYTLNASILHGKDYALQAPVSGEMSRTIRERASCPAVFTFYKGSKRFFSEYSPCASFENANSIIL